MKKYYDGMGHDVTFEVEELMDKIARLTKSEPEKAVVPVKAEAKREEPFERPKRREKIV